MTSYGFIWRARPTSSVSGLIDVPSNDVVSFLFQRLDLARLISGRLQRMGNGISGASINDVGLKRSLRLWDLILYGVIVIQPTAPMPLFGVLSNRAHGHAVTAILLAMIAMLFTAISYGRMTRAYPSAALHSLMSAKR